ncbi:ribose ABC transporter permease [Vallitalea longa]|uniref:Ribose ABC transporter permease n=1 Tax=Vallitalea longa TaxID=2936439 RepID=A0A9W5Y807_9FIRM|nr:ABC transporter permease [Vallitalea longa]GKX28094.1 ribose ABC transporter permease [Vallitalea longa]
MNANSNNKYINKISKFSSNHILEIILFIVSIIIAFSAPGFFTSGNLLNILRNASLKGVIAFGMTMVIITGEIDLSISSTVALSGVITGTVAGKIASTGIMSLEYSVIIGMIVAILAAALVGLVNAIIHTKFNIPTFIITLAMLNIVYGLAAIISKGFPVTTFPAWYSKIGAGQIGSIPIPAIILLVVFFIVWMVMDYTKFGRSVYAVGGNRESARLSGINVKFVKIIVLVMVQVTAAIAGIMVSSQVMSGAHPFGKGWEMDVISSVIIGGASLTGGIGKVKGTFIGIIFLGVLLNGMTLLNINEYVQYVVRGGLILMAVLINTVQSRKIV